MKKNTPYENAKETTEMNEKNISKNNDRFVYDYDILETYTVCECFW